MAEYLPIRALNRSQNVRIEQQRITATTTVYIDLSKAATRKEFASHASIGAVYPVGGITQTNAEVVVSNGVNTDEGAANNDMIVRTYSGVLKNRATSATVAVLQTDTTLATADATNPRIDIIEVKKANGEVKKVTGTAAASPVAPAVDAGYIAVAEVSVPANDTAITTNQVTDVRPLA